jgi:hypothetical protein
MGMEKANNTSGYSGISDLGDHLKGSEWFPRVFGLYLENCCSGFFL